MYDNLYRSSVSGLLRGALQSSGPTVAFSTCFRRCANMRAASSQATNGTKKSSILGSSTSQVIFSADQPAELPHRVSKLTAWAVTPSRMGISRHFTFSTFSAAFRFMSLVAEECKIQRHHPSWHNLYNQVTVEWTTHRPQGLSIKDVEMAEFCDRTAEDIGLKDQS